MCIRDRVRIVWSFSKWFNKHLPRKDILTTNLNFEWHLIHNNYNSTVFDTNLQLLYTYTKGRYMVCLLYTSHIHMQHVCIFWARVSREHHEELTTCCGIVSNLVAEMILLINNKQLTPIWENWKIIMHTALAKYSEYYHMYMPLWKLEMGQLLVTVYDYQYSLLCSGC